VLARGAPPVQYAAIKEVAQLPDSSGRFYGIAASYVPTLRLIVTQHPDGHWGSGMLSVPEGDDPPLTQVGTIPAVHRLLALGLDRDAPPFAQVRRVLFRLLAEDNDPAFAYELASASDEPERQRRARTTLREAAAAALAHLGYESDPRVRGCANRTLQRVSEYLESSLVADPWKRVGNKHALVADASPPSVYLLQILAYMPHYRIEHHGFLTQLLAYFAAGASRHEAQQVVGSQVVSQPHLLVGDPLGGRGGFEGDLGATLSWLELAARLGVIRRLPTWERAFERLLEERDRGDVWRPSRGKLPHHSLHSHAWAHFPLDERRDSDAIAADVTTQLGRIARLAGHEIELV